MAVCAAHDRIPGHVNMLTSDQLIKKFLDY
jgi:hypothetical protein